jgi:hypothetical protein
MGLERQRLAQADRERLNMFDPTDRRIGASSLRNSTPLGRRRGVRHLPLYTDEVF